MSTSFFRALAASACLLCPAVHAAPSAPPKLVLLIVVDGLPQEQVQRYRHQFGPHGLRRLLDHGAWFSNAHQAHGITVTAVGHAAILSGAYPYQHGVIGNQWFDRASGKWVYCTDDARHHYLGGEITRPLDGTSPARLRVPTLGDELRYATAGASKVVAVSGKDRGAILLAGHGGTAYMYMDATGNFASSSYYMQAHPDWVRRFNTARAQDRYLDSQWRPLLPEAAYIGDVPAPALPIRFGTPSARPDAAYYQALRTSPFLDELTLDFARAALDGEALGRNRAGVPDLLAISLSAHDLINHRHGPENRLSHDHLQRLDRMLGKFLDTVDARIGLENVLVVLTADHGFDNAPEFSAARGVPAGRIDEGKLAAGLERHLAERFGVAKMVREASMPNIYLDYDAAVTRGATRAEIEQEASRYLLRTPGIAQVYGRGMLEGGATGTRQDLLMRRAWHRQLSGDLLVVAQAHWMFSADTAGSAHGSPYNYDTSVPLMLMGRRWIAPGAYSHYTELVDLAPTLAHILRIRAPAGAEGRVLSQILR